MNILTVKKFLENSSFNSSYIIAGNNGTFHKMTSIEILESPFPEVEKYLNKNEFYLTSFWNSQNNKEKRINLVKSIINHQCAALAIMPGVYLKNQIDEEIINLGNQNDFPIIVLNNNCRWNDIIHDFYRCTQTQQISFGCLHFSDFLYIIDCYRENLNLNLLGNDLEGLMKLPINIYKDGKCYKSTLKNSEKVISKIEAIAFNNNLSPYSHVSFYIEDSILIECLVGKNSYISLEYNTNTISSEIVSVFRNVGNYLIKLFNNRQKNFIKVNSNTIILPTGKYYFFCIRKDKILECVLKIREICTVYDYYINFNILFGVLEYSDNSEKKIYQFSHKIIKEFSPQCFIFSEIPIYKEFIYNMSQEILSQLRSMHFLKGIFTVGEIPILRLLDISPSILRKQISNFNNFLFHPEFTEIQMDTLRLLVVMHSIKNVSLLLNVHPNTVKYRIEKILNFQEETMEAYSFLDFCNTELLIYIENKKFESLNYCVKEKI
ncbi:MAG: PucR family transcriptional regulator ligand-binding domain-containing protein [Peptostreptococcaceae bacterium]|nr:PucR family transcriptional regulator ligand-binding domain-containing protein [Peptostreptococcaceae bacterium]